MTIIRTTIICVFIYNILYIYIHVCGVYTSITLSLCPTVGHNDMAGGVSIPWKRRGTEGIGNDHLRVGCFTNKDKTT
jgi:hypothetical protein